MEVKQTCELRIQLLHVTYLTPQSYCTIICIPMENSWLLLKLICEIQGSFNRLDKRLTIQTCAIFKLVYSKPLIPPVRHSLASSMQNCIIEFEALFNVRAPMNSLTWIVFAITLSLQAKHTTLHQHLTL